MKINELHDAEISNISIDREKNLFSISVVTEKNTRKDLEFGEVTDISIDGFGIQNVIFNIEEHQLENASKEIYRDYGIDESWAKSSTVKAMKIFIIESSVGMYGYVIAARLKIL